MTGRVPTAQMRSDSKDIRSGGPEAVRVKLLGSFSVSVGSRTIQHNEWRLRKAAAWVKLLALSPGHRLHREQVMDLLWPDANRQAASNNLRQALHALRRIIATSPTAGSRYIASEEESLVLYPGGSLWVDVEAFEEAAATARRAREPAAYRAAIDLYAGELLPGDRYDEWAEARREELRRVFLSLLVELAGLYEERGGHELAIETLQRVLSEEPTRQEGHVRLMRLFALSGRQGAALRQFERLQVTLSRELAAEPAADTLRLREEIADGRFPPEQSALVPPFEELPPAGRHNLPSARSSFVGREREVVELKRELALTRLLTLTGVGGSGKTRLALEVARDLVGAYPDGVWLVELAGLPEGALVPQALAGALEVPERPGEPLTNTLAEVLRSRQVLLVMDNCEHLVVAVARLVDKMLDSCPRLRILATSRDGLGVEGELRWAVPSLSVSANAIGLLFGCWSSRS